MRSGDACFRAKVFQQALGLECQETAVGSLAERAIKQQDTRRMGRRVGYAQPTKAGSINAAGIKIGKIVRHQRCRSEEHKSELQSLMRISYDVFCLKKKNELKSNHNSYIIITHLKSD